MTYEPTPAEAALLEMSVAMMQRYAEAARMASRERACEMAVERRRVFSFGRKRG